MEKKFTISTPPPIHFPKITLTFCAPFFKTQNKKSSHTFTPSNQIAKTIETSKSKLNLV